jgi:hypothetical protein
MRKIKRLKGDHGTVIQFETPTLDSTPSYPHTYFATNPGKPSVIIPKNSKAALSYVTEQIQAAITVGTEIPSS